MADRISPDNFAEALRLHLTVYGKGVADRVNAAGETAIKDLVQKTKATAPKRSGSFRKNITYTAERSGHDMMRYTWHVKAPDHRLTHLLVHGHATKNGGRTPANPFLKNALDEILPEYERAVEEAVKNG